MTGAFARVSALLRTRGVTVPTLRDARTRGDLDVERRFHEELLLRNGVYRTTRAHRLDETLPGLIEDARALGRRPIRVLDVACSMGLATVELHTALRSAGLDCETLGTDLLLRATYVRRQDGCGLLFDEAGEVLQVDVGDWATSWRFRPRDRVFRPRLVAAARRLMGPDRAEFEAARVSSPAGFQVETLSLLHRSTEGVPGLRFAQEGLLEPVEHGPFDLIRAANILNSDYFAPEILVAMVDKLRQRLVEGGTLLVARNFPGASRTHATFFRHREGRLEPRARLGHGSEIARLQGGAARESTPPGRSDPR